MEKLLKYREVVIDFLKEKVARDHAGLPPYKSQYVTDTINDRYLYMHYGWEGRQYSYGVYIHLDIINDKIWLQRNYTEDEVIDKFLAAGVPPEDIVLGTVAPYMREATPYAKG
ncbi:MAG: XisI protein [Bacteroidota bacterium]